MTNESWSRIRRGALLGAALGGLLSLLAAAVIALRGGEFITQSGKLSLPLLMASYIIGSVIGGALVGLLYPLGKRSSGWYVLGVIGSLPSTLMISALIVRADGMWPTGVIVAAMASLIVGGGIGLAIYEEISR